MASVESYLALVGAVQGAAPQPLSALAAGILAAHHLGIAGDSRTFARQFELAHALVLRAVSELATFHLIETGPGDARTQRTPYILSRTGRDLLEKLPAAAAA